MVAGYPIAPHLLQQQKRNCTFMSFVSIGVKKSLLCKIKENFLRYSYMAKMILVTARRSPTIRQTDP